MKTGKPHPKRERGQALVETALSLMILIILLMGMVDFGLAFAHRVALTNASRFGARYASRNPRQPTLIYEGTIEALRGTIVLPDDYDVADPDPRLDIIIVCEDEGTEISCSGATRGNQVRVTVTYDYAPLFGGLLGITGDLTIGSSTLMYISWKPS